MFKPRPYDPSRIDNRTPAQKAACERNFRIFRLRALETNGALLTGKRRDRLTKLIDEELKALGAQITVEHQANFWRKNRARRPKREPAITEPDDIPF